MSDSCEVMGIIDPDVLLNKMLDLRAACNAVDIDYPQELQDYFDGDADQPEEYLRRQKTELDLAAIVEKVCGTDEWSYIVKISDMPKEVVAVRFGVSW